MSASVYALFVRSVPGVSIGYQKHLLSLKVITSQPEQGPWSFTGGFGRHEIQWVKGIVLNAHYKGRERGEKEVLQENNACIYRNVR